MLNSLEIGGTPNLFGGETGDKLEIDRTQNSDGERIRRNLFPKNWERRCGGGFFKEDGI